jgi:hypothetical protein
MLRGLGWRKAERRVPRSRRSSRQDTTATRSKAAKHDQVGAPQQCFPPYIRGGKGRAPVVVGTAAVLTIASG